MSARPKRKPPAKPQGSAKIACDVTQLYMLERQYAAIGEELDLTRPQVHKILSDLFAEGMPKRARHSMTDAQVRAIYAAYRRGGSIDRLASALGFTGSAARRQKHKRKLPLQRQGTAGKSAAQAEQYLTTALLMARVDELRRSRRLTLEELAQSADVSVWTLRQLRAQLSDPRLTTLLKLCSGLGVAVGELLGELPLPMEARMRQARQVALAGERG
jgi:DNA-binding Xre family transcriptional regulator